MVSNFETQSIGPSHRRLLRALVDRPRGSNVNAFLADGFTLETIADLVRNELATVQFAMMRKRGRSKSLALRLRTRAADCSKARLNWNELIRRAVWPWHSVKPIRLYADDGLGAPWTRQRPRSPLAMRPWAGRGDYSMVDSVPAPHRVRSG
jgi:hypothetical protein